MTIYKAPAKINLNLNIVGQRKDGYHLLDSIIIFTDWGDDITIKPATEFMLTADGPYSNIFTAELLSTNRGAPNLIVRAVYLMADKAGRKPAIHVNVTKNIPAGAGLGGGSSDAAAVMHALNNLWNMDLSLNDLSVMGLELGAELPACLCGRATRVSGIGDIITPIDVAPLYLLIVWPDRGLLTKDVFNVYRRHCEEHRDEAIQEAQSFKTLGLPRSLSLPRNDDFMEWLQSANNDLTSAAIELCPDIGELLSYLRESDGCITAQMSGSGSACFGVFDDETKAIATAKNFKNKVVTKT